MKAVCKDICNASAGEEMWGPLGLTGQLGWGGDVGTLGLTDQLG